MQSNANKKNKKFNILNYLYKFKNYRIKLNINDR